ncbi:hypothetical protein [Pseudoprimorskyibacter insulae]|uniref:Uncharacterized protein n=1 Tax=Pseudoprimorskyibacter insulae TaxID=1695997 RepID=A0A2R8AVZ0_9RHOB|nr:hypothetical protein [Pseudoprimorskyibacter insulae]SPF80064.1 hypothetical protein PRI8871_01866 [Pseudoprimorskyibacter insulae]
MNFGAGTALVPAIKRLTQRRSSAGRAEYERNAEYDGGDDTNLHDDWGLVRRRTTLRDTEKVIKHLPDILGRALARSWIDPTFSAAMMQDPLELLARHNVFLPDNISIVIETTASERQRVVVYERTLDGRRRRLLYLQLVMMAGK